MATLRSFYFILLALLVSTTSASSSLQTVNNAVLDNIFSKYASRDVIDKEDLKLFVETVLDYDDPVLVHKGKEQNVPTAGEDTSHANTVNILLDVCGVDANVSLCQEYIETVCMDEESLLDLLYQEVPLNRSNLVKILPSIVHYMYNPNCQERLQKHTQRHHNKPSTAQVWGYGVGFVSIICVVANVGAFMGPCMKKAFFQRILMFCVALAVGTLAGTGFMVLIPEALGLTGDDSPVPDYNFKTAAALGGVYFFYVFERLLKLGFQARKEAEDKNEEITAESPLTEVPSERKSNGLDIQEAPVSDHEHGHSHFTLDPKEKGGTKGSVKAVAWMILIGDALHNFMDGMSIGAAFTENTVAGITVSIAIICEELPHELGDIAILLHSGLTMKKSLLLNFLAATTCYIGLIIGIFLGENTNASVWIFAAAGGMFAYISLVDMIPEMGDQAKFVTEAKIETPFMVFFIQNLGLLVGFGIIFCLATLGHNIEI